jgi:hypothetical protein
MKSHKLSLFFSLTLGFYLAVQYEIDHHPLGDGTTSRKKPVIHIKPENRFDDFFRSR